MATTRSPRAPKKAAPRSEPTTRERTGALYAIIGPDTLKLLATTLEQLNEGSEGPIWPRNAFIKMCIKEGCALAIQRAGKAA